ncbi:MAG: Nif3-like dinuclear metal center hexameric protein [Methanomicrobiales archaeon]|nr:Nif3-like dinuclear metal center hexameric protein [Methanomicrobiales archaeon]
MQIRAVLNELEGIAPPDLAEADDTEKIGVIVEGDEEIRNVCCSVDVTPGVVEQAIARQCNLIVSHHNPFWDPLTSFQGYDARLLRMLLSDRITLYVMHTNFDRAPRGVNQTLARLLGLENIREMPMGVTGDCRLSLRQIGKRLNAPLRLYGNLDQLHTLALVGGSGFRSELIEYAWRQGADAFLSAELKHHVALRSPIPLLESTHYDLEAPAMRRLAEEQGWSFVETDLSCRKIP